MGGGFAGLAGATLVLAQVGTFAEKMTAGRGYVAIAIVVLGRWHPAGVAVAALLFGAATALQYVFQALGLAVPYQLFLMLPYVLTLLALAGAVGRVRRAGGSGEDVTYERPAPLHAPRGPGSRRPDRQLGPGLDDELPHPLLERGHVGRA